MERWLSRLSRSPFADRFVLKGALMLTVWKLPATRPTRDIDLLGRIDHDLEHVRTTIAALCASPVDDDGVVFDTASVKTEKIAEDADYHGVRATFEGRLGTPAGARRDPSRLPDAGTVGDGGPREETGSSLLPA
ncbi:MAG: nucleotidyl transferase AbiEii/AbiGii toxin family protein [Planctomycetes bacterium]|nr:nucleotidyl transferase AbiEii/AbiGii toxin family protein [Planctomycetota bacterium]